MQHFSLLQTSKFLEDCNRCQRPLVGIFAHGEVARTMAFRGGTALHELHLPPAARYSEDIDLVQVVAGPIGSVLDAMRGTLDPWLGEPKRVIKEGRVNLGYRMMSEVPPVIPMRLKIEINSVNTSPCWVWRGWWTPFSLFTAFCNTLTRVG